MTNNYSFHYVSIHLDTMFHTHIHIHIHRHIHARTSLFHRIVPFGEGPRPGDPCPFFHLTPLFSPLAIHSPAAFLRASSFCNELPPLFIEFLPTTAARRDYLWPLETIEERWKHPRIHFRIHPPPPLHEKRLGGRYEGGHHQFIEADRSSRRRWKQDAVYISIYSRFII